MSRLRRNTLNNFVRGAGSALSIHGGRDDSLSGIEYVLYNPHKSINDAIRSDWVKVGTTLSYIITHETAKHDEEER